MTRLPAGIHDNIFTRVGTKLYTAGGKTYFGFPATEWRNLDNLWSYDIVRRRWQVESAMLEPGKAYSGIATLGDEVWLLGGHFRDGNDLIPTDTVEIYNPIAQTLRHGPRLPSPRTQCVALALDQRIYAIGGAGPGRAFLTNMYSIDTAQSSWREEPAPPGPIAQASGCVLDGKLYVAAGSLVKCPGLYVYDPALRRWDSIDHPLPDAPGAPLTAALDGEVWVMGGAGTDEGRATFIYRPQAGIWRRGPELPAPLSWGAAAAIEGRIFIAGGAFLSPDHPLHVNSDRSFLLRTQGHE
jgi:N-acetylneuraminic acid mutarotase